MTLGSQGLCQSLGALPTWRHPNVSNFRPWATYYVRCYVRHYVRTRERLILTRPTMHHHNVRAARSGKKGAIVMPVVVSVNAGLSDGAPLPDFQFDGGQRVFKLHQTRAGFIPLQYAYTPWACRIAVIRDL